MVNPRNASRIIAVAAVSLVLLTSAALAIVLVIAFATVGEAVHRAHWRLRKPRRCQGAALSNSTTAAFRRRWIMMTKDAFVWEQPVRG